MVVNDMLNDKKVYPTELQESMLQEAVGLIRQRYGEDASVLGIYLSGSIVDRTFGEYEKPTHQDGEPRLGSDIDVMLVIKNRLNFLPLPDEDQKHYSVRHIGKKPDIPVYRMIDENGQDVFLRGKHPVEPMIVTEGLFEGWLSGKYKWGNEQSRPFPELVREYIIVKETGQLREIRERHVR